jgi:hypothetical protein
MYSQLQENMTLSQVSSLFGASGYESGRSMGGGISYAFVGMQGAYSDPSTVRAGLSAGFTSSTPSAPITSKSSGWYSYATSGPTLPASAYEAIQASSSLASIQALLGSAGTETYHFFNASYPSYQYVWRFADAYASVSFNSTAVTSKSIGRKPASTPGTITATMVDQISVGMDQNQVIAILGRQPDNTSTGFNTATGTASGGSSGWSAYSSTGTYSGWVSVNFDANGLVSVKPSLSVYSINAALTVADIDAAYNAVTPGMTYAEAASALAGLVQLPASMTQSVNMQNSGQGSLYLSFYGTGNTLGNVSRSYYISCSQTAGAVLPTSLKMTAPTTVLFSESATLSASVSYSNSTSKTVTPTWSSSNPAAATISTAGVLTAGKVSIDTPVTITASYTENGTTVTASQIITITAPDTTPDTFSFSSVTGVAPESSVSSNTIVVTGINSPAVIAIAGGEYSINGGIWTSATGAASLGNQIKVRLTAPSGYNATGSVSLSIGGVPVSFNVTTQSYVKVTAATQVFANPQTAEITDDGIIRFRTTPTQPVTLASAATENAVVRIDDQQTLSVVSQQSTLSYTPASSSTRLQVRSVDGSPALVPIAGRVGISAPAAQSVIPVTADSAGSAKLLTTQANTQVTTGRDEQRNIVVAVTNSPVTYQATGRGRSLPTSFTVYPGEAVVADEAGTAGQVRVGSFAQDGNQAGDFIAGIPRIAATLKVPKITTASAQRFGSPWTNLVGQAIASKLNLGNFVSLSQDSATGVLTLVTNQGSHRFLPVGSLALAEAAFGVKDRAISVADIAANLTAVLDSSLSFAVAPATAYADLEAALKGIDSTASLEILGDGVLLATLSGTGYVAQSASRTTTGSSASCPGFVTENNQLALCDASGNRQVLYGAFADTDTLRDTFRTALSLPTLSVSNTGSNGIYSANVGGTPYSLAPDITLATPPAAQAGKLWWIDAATNKIFIRYPSGQAQGFGL